MALVFPANAYIQYPAPVLDTKTVVIVAVRCRIDTLDNTSQQMVFRHRLGSSGTDQMSLRKNNSTDKWRASVTAGGVAVTKDSTLAAVEGTIYDLMMSWVINDSTGLRLWINGVEDGTGASTTGQTGTYNTAGGTLSIGCRDGGFDDFQGAIERLVIYTAGTPSDDMAQHFAWGGWPKQRPEWSTPSYFWPLFDHEAGGSTIHDLSGNNRDITTITGTLTGDNLGIVQPQGIFEEAGYIEPPSGGSGPPTPNDWTEYTGATFDHPDPGTGPAQWTINVDGLTNGTLYEFMAHAVNAGGLESSDSDVVEDTPSAPAPLVSVLNSPWRRFRRFSRFKGSQQ